MKVLFVVGVMLLLVAGLSHGSSVIYQFVETGTDAIRGELEFKSPPASATSDWTSVDLDLSANLEGGISGFRFDFGSGLETALSGDLYQSTEIGSSSGGSLDFGHSQSFPPGVPGVYFSSGVIQYMYFFSKYDDFITFDLGFGSLNAFGDWVQSPPPVIPEPSTTVLFGLGFFGILGYIYRCKRRK